MKIQFQTIPYESSEWRSAVKLREDVLRKPLGQTFSAQELEEERQHIHVAGYLNQDLVATAVLVPEDARLKMQRVAVQEELRNGNIGSSMMIFCEDWAQENDYSVVYCHARDSAVNFYSRNGYLPEGDYFDEDGIPHLKMSKQIG
ncbi:GNAT family N-acetyltransferase [bacterium SCSIO 12741]|nr:GNAT family N-acetyltransferase [bacterium SCSIO 12741]